MLNNIIFPKRFYTVQKNIVKIINLKDYVKKLWSFLYQDVSKKYNMIKINNIVMEVRFG